MMIRGMRLTRVRLASYHLLARNLSERCPGDQTNNRAELIVRIDSSVSHFFKLSTQAIVRILETTPPLKRKLLIKTDSKYSIQCHTFFVAW